MFASKDIFLKSSGGAYQISRSVRTRSSASAYFNRTPASATNRRTWTWSGWVKRGAISNSTINILFSAGTDSTAGTGTNINFGFTDSGGDQFSINADNTSGFCLVTTQLFRDPSAWYHIVVAIDTTQATASNRAKLYVNGNQVTAFSTATYPTQNRQFDVNNTVAHNISRRTLSATYYFDGYLTEVNFIDGQALTPSSFGETNAVTGVWQPKAYSGTYGTNGFELNFSDNSTAAALGTDFSGNSNTWTVNNISVTAGTTYDSMLDVPTNYADGGNGRGNYSVVNPLDFYSNPTVTNGNLQFATSGAGNPATCRATFGVSSGKWYWEVTQTAGSARGTIGIAASTASLTTGLTSLATGYSYNGIAGNKYNNGTATAYGASYTTGDVIGVALDMDAGTIVFYKNNTSQGTAFTGLSGLYSPAFSDTGGANISFAITFAVNFGQQPFTYTPPTGYVALNTQNLSTPTISNGATVMAASTYTGTGATQTIANSGNNPAAISFQPDFVWVKGRSGATDHALYDSVRGTTKDLASNTTAAETTQSTGLTAFGSTGFTIGALAKMNTSSATYVGWQWKAGGTAVTNTDGTITTTVSASPSSGFSVMTYTGTGIDNKTIGHGLNAVPKFLIWKPRASVTDWMVWHTGLSGYNYDVRLNTTAAQSTGANPLNNTAPTSTVITLRNQGDVNGSGTTIVCYAFAAVAGYSAFGSYTGNGSADGPFVYLGFRPRFLMVKNSSAVGNWLMFDSSRDTYNPEVLFIFANTSDAEQNSSGTVSFDFLSNGFKVRNTSGNINGSGNTLIYMAFAENPFKLSLAR